MPGFDNSVVYFEKGIDPRGVSPVVNQMTSGTLLIGSNVSPFVICATLTQGTGIKVVNGPGSITLNSSGLGLTWTVVGAGGALAVNNGYICTGGAALSFSLPATSAVGDVIGISLDGSTSWTITQAAGQQIRIANSQTTSGTGTLVSTAQGDSLVMVCSVANLKWNVINITGNITVT